jgi:uroporphyrinogen decarboxylase
MCSQPELAAEVTLQPVRALGVDAAILFADILLPLVPMGFELEFAAGEGPVIHNRVTGEADIARLRPVEPRESLAHVLQAVRLIRAELPPAVPLIGFAGAPFTLASYVIQGGSAREAVDARRMMLAAPEAWHGLMDRLADVVRDYLLAQVEAGAQAIQLFDSWAGALAPADYRDFVLPYSARVLRAVSRTGVPVIHFGTGTATLLPLMREAGGSVLGIDWRTPLARGREVAGRRLAIQGNLDPVALFAPRRELGDRVRRVLHDAASRRGHIFNLGHGILQHTPVDAVKYVVDLVHESTTGPLAPRA